MRVVVFFIRSVFALFFLAYGINYFYHLTFVPAIPVSSRFANDFLNVILRSHYLYETIYGTMIACGFFMLINRFTPLFLIILFPITINIFLFNYFYDLDSLTLASWLLIYHLVLMIIYHRAYGFLFLAKARFMKYKLFVNFKD